MNSTSSFDSTEWSQDILDVVSSAEWSQDISEVVERSPRSSSPVPPISARNSSSGSSFIDEGSYSRKIARRAARARRQLERAQSNKLKIRRSRSDETLIKEGLATAESATTEAAPTCSLDSKLKAMRSKLGKTLRRKSLF